MTGAILIQTVIDTVTGLHLHLPGKARPPKETYVPDQRALIAATSLLKASREGAAAMAAGNLFHYLMNVRADCRYSKCVVPFI